MVGSKRASGTSPKPVVMTEALEARRLLTTFVPLAKYIAGDGFYDIDNAPGVSVSYSSSGTRGLLGPSGEASTVTATVSGLPPHTMISVWAQEDGAPSLAQGASSTLTITAAGQTRTHTSTYQQGSVTGNLGKWAAHSGSTLTVTYSASLSAGASGMYSRCNLYLTVYQPTITASGGGALSEVSPSTVSFTATRDEPIGYLGVSFGDEAIPDTTVAASRGGTAIYGADYEGSLPASSFTFTNGQTLKNFDVTVINDGATESNKNESGLTESITWTVPTTNTALPTILTATITDDARWYYTNWTTIHKPSPMRTPLVFKGEDVSLSNDGTWKYVTRYYIYDIWVPAAGRQVSASWENNNNDVTPNLSVEFSQETQYQIQISGGQPVTFAYSESATSGTSVGTSSSFPSVAAGEDEKVMVVPLIQKRHLITEVVVYQSNSLGGWVYNNAYETDQDIGYTGGINYASFKCTRVWLDPENSSRPAYRSDYPLEDHIPLLF
ncbi:MAG TPA: hypothetical protein VF595_12485 [Tepidisphaeraceae bacterium]|jgi:hypothetical protein